MNRGNNIPRGLYRYVPVLTVLGHGAVLEDAIDITALVEAHPADLRQIDTVAFQFETLGVSERSSAFVFLLELREFPRIFWVECGVYRTTEFLKALLMYLRMHVLKEGKLFLPYRQLRSQQFVGETKTASVKKLFLKKSRHGFIQSVRIRKIALKRLHHEDRF